MSDPIPVKVQWPAKALSSEGDDLAPALRSLLEDLRLLETKTDEKEGVGPLKTPQSLQVLTAGATTLTKLYTGLATLVGGGGALVAGIYAFWKSLDPPVAGQPDQSFKQAALMIAVAVLGSAVVIAVSLMVRGDVCARAEAHAAAYAARASVAASFLRTVEAALPKSPSVTPYYVKKRDSWKPVDSFEWDNGIVAVTNGDKIPVREISGLLRTDELEANS